MGKFYVHLVCSATSIIYAAKYTSKSVKYQPSTAVVDRSKTLGKAHLIGLVKDYRLPSARVGCAAEDALGCGIVEYRNKDALTGVWLCLIWGLSIGRRWEQKIHIMINMICRNWLGSWEAGRGRQVPRHFAIGVESDHVVGIKKF